VSRNIAVGPGACRWVCCSGLVQFPIPGLGQFSIGLAGGPFGRGAPTRQARADTGPFIVASAAAGESDRCGTFGLTPVSRGGRDTAPGAPFIETLSREGTHLRPPTPSPWVAGSHARRVQGESMCLRMDFGTICWAPLPAVAGKSRHSCVMRNRTLAEREWIDAGYATFVPRR
jgi:hypothetical protein